MDNKADGQEEAKREPQFRCYQEDGCWYCETDDRRFGPFDCLIETVMGEFKHKEREICEPQLSEELAAMS